MLSRVVVGNTINVPLPLFVDLDDELPQNADTTPTVTCTRADGTVLAAPAVANVSTGLYTAKLLAATHTNQLDQLTVTATGLIDGDTVTNSLRLDVVGGRYVSIPEIRAQFGMDDPSIDTETLRSLRDEFETGAERFMGKAFVPRYNRELLDGSGTSVLATRHMFIRTVRKITQDGTVQTGTFTGYRSGEIMWANNVFLPPTIGGRNIIAEYEYGADSPPADLRQAALTYIRRRALARANGLEGDATAESAGGYQIQYETANAVAGKPTGIASVDSVLVELSGGARRILGIA